MSKFLIKNKHTGEWDVVNEYVFVNQKFIEEYEGQPTVKADVGQQFEVRGIITGNDISGLTRFFQLPQHQIAAKINEPEVVKISRGNSCVMHHIKTGENWVRRAPKKVTVS